MPLRIVFDKNKKNNPTLAIIEFRKGGHHDAWLKFFSDALFEKSCVKEIKLEKILFPISGFFKKIVFWMIIFIVVNKKTGNFFFPYVHDSFNYLFVENSIFRYLYKNIFSIYMYTRDVYSNLDKKSKICNFFNKFAKNDKILFIDESLIEQLCSFRCIKSKLVFMPDFTSTVLLHSPTKNIQKVKTFINGRKVLLCIGSIYEAKNIPDLGYVFKNLPSKDWVLLIVGKSANYDVYKNLNLDSYDNVHILDRHIPTEEEFNSIIELSTVVWCAYADWPLSSNIQVKAAVIGRPTIAFSDYLLGYRTGKYKLGFVGNISEIALEAQKGFPFITSWDSDSEEIISFRKIFSQEEAKKIIQQEILTHLEKQPSKIRILSFFLLPFVYFLALLQGIVDSTITFLRSIKRKIVETNSIK